MGYSQGANVVGDALAGTGRPAAAVPKALADRVDAVVLFGDPTFTAGEPFDVTDGDRSGVFSRGAGRLDAFAARTQSFCDRDDRFCQSGPSVAAHLDYAQFPRPGDHLRRRADELTVRGARQRPVVPPLRR